VHHSLTDGAGAIELLLNLFDFEREPERSAMLPVPVAGERSPTGLVTSALQRASLHGMSNAARRIGGLVGRAKGVVLDPRGKINGARTMAGSMRRVAKKPPADPSPLLSRRGLDRRLVTLDVPLDGLRAAAKSADCSVNDAYMAALCGALRRYHEALGVSVDALPFAMPISVRTDDDPVGGNRFAGARLAAPVGELDPVERMRTIRAIVRAAVDEPAMNAAKVVAPLLSKLPNSLLGALSSTAAGTDVQASNIVGYSESLYIAGAEINKMYWFGPLPGVAMMVVLISEAGTCYVGVHYDTASVTDTDLFARCLREGFDEVLAVAPASTRT
jgi:WS/DGAT/MGAT family acyltransferase